MKTRLSIIGTAFALTLAIAPAAQSAGMHPDDRAVPRATSPALVTTLHADDRAVPRATSPALVTTLHPDDRALPRATNPIEAPALVRASDRGFDWTEFVVGAGGGFGIALALLGATLIFMRRVHRAPRPA